MEDTVISVHVYVVMSVVEQLLAATADAHSPRSLVRAIATALASLPITRVELRPLATAELAGGQWRCLETAAVSPRAKLVVPGLAIVAKGALPDWFASDEFRTVLAQIIAAATRHLDVIQRVAKLSQRAHVEARDLRAERIQSRVVARSSAMRAAVARAQLVARHPTTVLLTGESGTGKEVLAHEIHRLSPRAHRPFVQINCGAIPESLTESELFGHERGAFTGAERAHAGVFERAHRGTLLLDEVGDLPLAAQAKLLRVLQERRVHRVGGEAPIEVDVRLIAATHQPLLAMIDQGRFREDLYYRLEVFAIHIPPLRERRGDLGPLVTMLLREIGDQLGVDVPPIPRGMLGRLETWDWPGNVRELRNVLERALIMSGGETLDVPDFPRRTRSGRDFESAVRVAIERALRESHGKLYGVGGAAELLGLPPGTLQSKMRKLGIERTAFTTPRA